MISNQHAHLIASVRKMLLPAPPAAGWFLLEAALVRHGGNRIAKLYVDAGRGYIENDSIFIPSNRRGSITEVVYLPQGLNNVRWSPMESSGRFSQSALIFHRITALESFFRRAWRVWSDSWRLRHLPLAERGGVIEKIFLLQQELIHTAKNSHV